MSQTVSTNRLLSLALAAVLAMSAALSVLLSGCCSSGRYVPQPGEDVPDSLEFFDSFSFDRKLSRSLGMDYARVEVTFPAAITLNNIPERMDKWLAAVEESGGRVQVAPESYDERGILEEIFTFFVRAYEHLAGVCLYARAENYDALLLYEKPTGIVTCILFLRRVPETGQDDPRPPTNGDQP